MSHLDLIHTVHLPVGAVGCTVRNSFGVTICEATDSFMATAIAELMNLGQDGAEAKNAAYSERESRIEGMIFNGLLHRI